MLPGPISLVKVESHQAENKEKSCSSDVELKEESGASEVNGVTPRSAQVETLLQGARIGGEEKSGLHVGSCFSYTLKKITHEE